MSPVPNSCISMLKLPSYLRLSWNFILDWVTSCGYFPSMEWSLKCCYSNIPDNWEGKQVLLKLNVPTMNLSSPNTRPNPYQLRYKHVGPCECVRLETSEYSATCKSKMIYRYHDLVWLYVKISCTDKVSCLSGIVVCGINLFLFPIVHCSSIEQWYREHKLQNFKSIIRFDGLQRNGCNHVFADVLTFFLG